MSVSLRGGVYWYSFRWKKRRYRGSTQQRVEADAVLVESSLKLKLRQEAGGIGILDAKHSPRIAEWAGVYYEHASRHVTRPERIDDLLRVVLRFWGEKEKDPVAGQPYHDLRLLDPIVDPMWIERFEKWMTQRGRAGQTRNQYRSVMSQMYKLALSPAYRSRTGVRFNPFLGIVRDSSEERTVTVSVEELRAWLSQSSYHVRLAVAIAALAPKLRLTNILRLEWATHLDRDFQRITVTQHKTARKTGRPLVVPIPAQLKEILIDARARTPGDYVITYRGEPIESIRGGLAMAAKRAGLTYGRVLGVTFHTIRHTMATMLAELSTLDGQAPLSESERKEAMGHKRLETTQRYTHIRPVHQVAALERLSTAAPILDIVTLPWRRISTKPRDGGVAASVSVGGDKSSESLRNRADVRDDVMTSKSGSTADPSTN